MKRCVWSLLATLLLVGCASGTLRPGTGDISFRLLWTGQYDLDLYVRSPLGERIDFMKREAPSGGMLDIDCNVESVIETNPCSEPMENIFWPRGKAPAGEFRFWVVIADPKGVLGDEDVFKVEVRQGDGIVRQEIGRVVDLLNEPPIWTITYPVGE